MIHCRKCNRLQKLIKRWCCRFCGWRVGSLVVVALALMVSSAEAAYKLRLNWNCSGTTASCGTVCAGPAPGSSCVVNSGFWEKTYPTYLACYESGKAWRKAEANPVGAIKSATCYSVP